LLSKSASIPVNKEQPWLVKTLDLTPANLGLSPAVSHMNRGWRQEGHPAKIAPVHFVRAGTSEPS